MDVWLATMWAAMNVYAVSNMVLTSRSECVQGLSQLPANEMCYFSFSMRYAVIFIKNAVKCCWSIWAFLASGLNGFSEQVYQLHHCAIGSQMVGCMQMS